MEWIISALILCIWLNMTALSDASWPIGSAAAAVITGSCVKTGQNIHFEALRGLLKPASHADSRNIPTGGEGSV